jgi:hypothetical protein
VSRAAQVAALPRPRSGSHERLVEPLRLLHHHPGYLRVQADAFLQPAEEGSIVALARAAIATLPGFRGWSHHPRTRSVVVEYDPDLIEADDLLQHIARRVGARGVEANAEGRRNRGELVIALLDVVQAANGIVGQMTGERADLRELVPAALAAVSLVSFVLHEDRGRLPRWDSALYHAYRIFMQWHRREVRVRERAARQEEEIARAGKSRGSTS